MEIYLKYKSENLREKELKGFVMKVEDMIFVK